VGAPLLAATAELEGPLVLAVLLQGQLQPLLQPVAAIAVQQIKAKRVAFCRIALMPFVVIQAMERNVAAATLPRDVNRSLP
jgi:hypothetical protein